MGRGDSNEVLVKARLVAIIKRRTERMEPEVGRVDLQTSQTLGCREKEEDGGQKFTQMICKYEQILTLPV